MFYKVVYVVTGVLLLNVVCSDRARELRLAKDSHSPKELTDAQLFKLSQLDRLSDFNRVLDDILIPRVVGTPNHAKVGDAIVREMSAFGWDVEQSVFADHTPVFGKLNFRNVIARLNPDASRYLVLACHYDSKYERDQYFEGATDSAVPCTMMINMAQTLRPYLDRIKSRSDLSLAFIFFDGEEAFHNWGPKDSIYGARHLARKWENTQYPSGESTTELHRIDMLVLLDLLGAPDPVFYSYFPSSERWYSRLSSAETRLAAAGLLQGYSRGKPEQRYFRMRSSSAHIEDDHIPFMKRDVKVLHLIPTPFPAVWHTPHDNRANLDTNTIGNLNRIFRVFLAEYLHLDV